MRPIALVRPPSREFADAITDRPPVPPLDADLALRQHAAYCAALRAGGFTVRHLTPAPGHPDACFVEDVLVVIGDRGLVTRPGHPLRRGETAGIDAAATGLTAVEQVEPPATIDGGDVLQVGGTIYVGRSDRTDHAGIERLAAFAGGRPVVPVDVSGVLHLKSAVTAVSEDAVLLFPGVVDESALSELRTITVPGDDPEVANVVRLPDGRVLVGSVASREIVRSEGFETVSVDVSEFGRAGGGLTCLSVRLRDVYGAESP